MASDGRIMRLQPELGGMFADAMDIVSLSAWRLTCKTNYHQATSSFRRSLIRLIRPFVPSPQLLLDITNKFNAVFGGELALSFILRDPFYLPLRMDIYAGVFEFDSICDAFLDEPTIQAVIDTHVYINISLVDALRLLVTRTLSVRTIHGKTICIHRSHTISSIAPICRAACTALSNFVTPYSFGCSHPSLTFNRRALLADLGFPHQPLFQHDVLAYLLKHRFSLAVSPAAWPEYRELRASLLAHSVSPFTIGGMLGIMTDTEWDDSREITQACWRHLYVCPSQGRFFGDRGSLIGFIDPLNGDETFCEANNIPPFGQMVIWRISSTFECNDACDFDDILEEGVSSIPILVKSNPVGEVRDVISDRYLGH